MGGFILIPIFIASLRRVFCRPAVSVNLNVAQAAPSVSFLAGQQNPLPRWMQTSFASLLGSVVAVAAAAPWLFRTGLAVIGC
jgi:hypothetical protein